MNILLFEDNDVEQLRPITWTRPAFTISCGSFCLADLIARLGRPTGYIVQPHLEATCRLDFPNDTFGDGPLLLLNARMVPASWILPELSRLTKSGKSGLLRHGQAIAAAIVPADVAAGFETLSHSDLNAKLKQLDLPALGAELPLLSHPHDIIKNHEAIFTDNLELRIGEGKYEQHADGVFLGQGAKLGEHVVFDSSDGPIVLEDNVQVGPLSFLSGPLYVGRGATINEQASIKHHVSLGHTTKVGGEVSKSILEPYSNKQHFGFLGHSYLGSWVNLGAGTSNSNLKNTYGKINMDYGNGERVATDMQFMGCVVGDYSKSAINTSIFTGKIIGVGSMLYGFITRNVPGFVNYARSFGQISEVTPRVMTAIQARTFGRRGVSQRPCDIELMEAIYQLTQSERDALDDTLSDDPLSL